MINIFWLNRLFHGCSASGNCLASCPISPINCSWVGFWLSAISFSSTFPVSRGKPRPPTCPLGQWKRFWTRCATLSVIRCDDENFWNGTKFNIWFLKILVALNDWSRGDQRSCTVPAQLPGKKFHQSSPRSLYWRSGIGQPGFLKLCWPYFVHDMRWKIQILDFQPKGTAVALATSDVAKTEDEKKMLTCEKQFFKTILTISGISSAHNEKFSVTSEAGINPIQTLQNLRAKCGLQSLKVG